jgi:carbonic anhydrase/acetyltransferase-like protein (isoleucine patch superfamily)
MVAIGERVGIGAGGNVAIGGITVAAASWVGVGTVTSAELEQLVSVPTKSNIQNNAQCRTLRTPRLRGTRFQMLCERVNSHLAD